MTHAHIHPAACKGFGVGIRHCFVKLVLCRHGTIDNSEALRTTSLSRCLSGTIKSFTKHRLDTKTKTISRPQHECMRDLWKITIDATFYSRKVGHDKVVFHSLKSGVFCISTILQFSNLSRIQVNSAVDLNNNSEDFGGSVSNATEIEFSIQVIWKLFM